MGIRDAFSFMSAIIAHLSLELHFPRAHSLKEKRQSLKRIKDRIANHFNVSLVESAYQDKWQRSKIDIVIIGLDQHTLENTIQKMLRTIEDISMGKAEILLAEIDWY